MPWCPNKVTFMTKHWNGGITQAYSNRVTQASRRENLYCQSTAKPCITQRASRSYTLYQSYRKQGVMWHKWLQYCICACTPPTFLLDKWTCLTPCMFTTRAPSFLPSLPPWRLLHPSHLPFTTPMQLYYFHFQIPRSHLKVLLDLFA
jgi:hypothetical protein